MSHLPDLSNVKLAIIGLGYVGLPLAVEFGKIRSVLGFDINPNRIAQLKSGLDVTLETEPEELQAAKHLSFSTSQAYLKACNCFIVTVPTPIDQHKRPDLGPLIKASETVGKLLKAGDIVIYESTVYPGCTEEDCVPVLEKFSGLKFNQDFFCGYSPERINPGDKEHRIITIKKVTSGSTPEVADLVDSLYRQIITAGTHKACSIRVAEAAKVIENTQRDINIAFVNELAKIYNVLGINTQDVLAAAATKWNFLPFKPGLVGGHCIGVDPYYLAYKAKEYNYVPKLILSGRKINESMGKYVAVEIQKILNKNRINIKTAQVAVLGFSFKENIPDIRNTKIFNIIKELQKQKIKIKVFDSVASKDEVKEKYKINLYNFKDLNKFKYDVIILAVAHKNFLKKISYYNKFYKDNKNKIFVDIKNKYSNYDLLNNGYKYFQL
jgi:UDP-N-acetyl-D-galactosamine dehydrogenase